LARELSLRSKQSFANLEIGIRKHLQIGCASATGDGLENLRHLGLVLFVSGLMIHDRPEERSAGREFQK
jgi:hypothetical protein